MKSFIVGLVGLPIGFLISIWFMNLGVLFGVLSLTVAVFGPVWEEIYRK